MLLPVTTVFINRIQCTWLPLLILYVQSDSLVSSNSHSNSRQRKTCRKRARRRSAANRTDPSVRINRDHFVVSPEFLSNVDRQLMEIILKTVEHIATRNEFRALCA
eukprot:5369972-Pleurochrysis_carterae.AAC.2